jgi:hypothetical protein
VTGDREHKGITLADGATGGQFLSALLREAVAEFPAAFSELVLPADDTASGRARADEPRAAGKDRFVELLPQFEAARLQSHDAAEIARALCFKATAQLRYSDAAGERPLAEALREPVPALPLVRVDLPGPRRLVPAVDYAGRLYEGEQLESLALELLAAGYATRAAVSALTEVGARAHNASGLSLRGERFVLFGAGAELGPVYTLLEAGADVLWLDLHKPPIDRLLEPQLGGSLWYVEAGVDLLTQPASVRATILEFALGEPVHLGLHAFAAGGACPLRLALGMNELARSLPEELVKSIAYLLAPTSVSFIYPEDAAQADDKAKHASKVQRALLRTGTLQRGHIEAGAQRLSRAVVSQQGAAYQVAEYVGKRLAAEAFVEFGSALQGIDSASPLAVSANMAPITTTRSLESPVLEAAVLGVPSFGMMIAQPSTSRSVSALLTVFDVLYPRRGETPQARRAALFEKQFHGGVHAQPYGLEGIMRLSTLRGIAQRPNLALELLR